MDNVVDTLKLYDKLNKSMGIVTKSIDKVKDAAKKMEDSFNKVGTSITKFCTNISKIKSSITSKLLAPFTKAKDILSKFDKSLSTSMKNINFEKLDELKTNLSMVGSKLTTVGSKLTDQFTKPILNAGVSSFKLASDLSESMRQVDNTFGHNSKQIKNWSETTLKSYGLSQENALDMVNSYGNLAASVGITTNKAGKMSQKIAGLAGDFASYHNVTSDVAKSALEGIFTGDTSSLNKYGIAINEANLKEFAKQKGMKKTIDQMTEAEKVQLRYKYVLANTKNIQGDFTKNSSSAANQQKILKADVDELTRTFGQKLLPIGIKIIKWIISTIDKFKNLSDGHKNLILKVAGLVAAVGPCLLVFGKIVLGVASMINIFKSVCGAISAAGSVMALITSPAGIVIGVIAAIAVAAFLIIKNWSKLKSFFSKFGSFVVSIFKKTGINTKVLSNTFKTVKSSINVTINQLKKIFSKIITFIKPILKFVGGVFLNSFKIYFAVWLGRLSSIIQGVSTWVASIIRVFKGLIKFVKGVFTGNWKQAWEGVKDVFIGIFSSLGCLIKTPLNMVIGTINGAIAGINSLGLKIPKWVPLLGGKSFTINVPTIPMLAKGTNNWKGGLALTQEKGGEIMDLPRGTRIYPHDKSLQMARAEGAMAGSGSSISINISKLADKLEVRSDRDIDAIAKKLADKLEVIMNNTGKVEYA